MKQALFFLASAALILRLLALANPKVCFNGGIMTPVTFFYVRFFDCFLIYALKLFCQKVNCLFVQLCLEVA